MKLETALPKKFPLARRLTRILVILLTLTFFIGVVIVPFEIDDPNRRIHNAFDGIWWAMTTVTTVGYGDMIPVTVGGRIVAMIWQLVGIILFGSFIGVTVTYLNHVEGDYRWKNVNKKLDRLEDENKALHNKLDFLVKTKGNAIRKSRQLGL